MFEHLELEDLKQARLVCKLWNIISHRYLATKGAIRLEGLQIERFIKFLNASNDLNLPNVMFHNISLKIDSYLSLSPMMLQIWTQIGPSIENLHLEITTFYALNTLQEIVFTFCPQLKSVKVIVTKFWPPDDSILLGKMQPTAENISDATDRKNCSLHSFSYTYLGSMSLYGYSDEDMDFTFPLCWEHFFYYFPCLQVYFLQ